MSYIEVTYTAPLSYLFFVGRRCEMLDRYIAPVLEDIRDESIPVEKRYVYAVLLESFSKEHSQDKELQVRISGLRNVLNRMREDTGRVNLISAWIEKRVKEIQNG